MLLDSSCVIAQMIEVCRKSFGAEDELKVHDGPGKRGKAKVDVIGTIKLRCMVREFA